MLIQGEGREDSVESQWTLNGLLWGKGKRGDSLTEAFTGGAHCVSPILVYSKAKIQSGHT